MKSSDVLVLGAGAAGLSAARTLTDFGISTRVLDKGRGVGGRMATRRMGDRNAPRGRWDHGAQFATFRSSALMDTLRAWNAWDLMAQWIPAHEHSDLMRRRPIEGMNAFAKRLAEGLDIHTSQRVNALRFTPEGWEAHTESREVFRASTLLCTFPPPQCVALFRTCEGPLSPEPLRQLAAVDYQPALTLLAEMAEPELIPPPGYMHPSSGVLDTVADQHRKGVSKAYTIVAHATPLFSREWIDRDRSTALGVLRAALSEVTGGTVIHAEIHGWRYARPVERVGASFLRLGDGLYAAGDGFAAGDEDALPDERPRIESALLSGRAAAMEIADRMGH